MFGESILKSTLHRWKESMLAKVSEWSVQSDVEGVRGAHFWIITALMAFVTFFYYVDQTRLVSISPFNHSFFTGVHDALRALFFVPIIYATLAFRVRGSLITSFVFLCVVLPRALLFSPYPNPLLRSLISVATTALISLLLATYLNQLEKERKGHAESSKLHEELSQYHQRFDQRLIGLEILVRGERNKLLSILEGIEDRVLIVGSDYRIRFTNLSIEKEFGEGVGSYCYRYLFNFDGPCERLCRLPNIIGGATERLEYVFSDGRTLEGIASPFVDSDGKVCQLTILRDITQRKRVELELIELGKLKSELLSNVSHELRSPLTSIKGIISSLLQKDIKFDDETRDMLLVSVSEETDRLARLVTNLLDMSKLEAGVWKPEKERCHISDIINEALERQKWVHKQHIFEIDLEPDLPEIYADYSQIRQVLINLLENAVAYSKGGTKIVVRARSVNGGVEVSVSDQGMGIPREDLGKIFDKFYRGSQKRQGYGGAGLGLAICQAIILSHGGQIWAESEIGQGSMFHFTLPVLSQTISEA